MPCFSPIMVRREGCPGRDGVERAVVVLGGVARRALGRERDPGQRGTQVRDQGGDDVVGHGGGLEHRPARGFVDEGPVEAQDDAVPRDGLSACRWSTPNERDPHSRISADLSTRTATPEVCG